MASTPESDPRFQEFLFLQTQNAGLFLGHIPDPRTGERRVNLRAARSVLDSLEMLENKTRGNLVEQEEKLLATALKHLRPMLEKAEKDQQKSEVSPARDDQAKGIRKNPTTDSTGK